MREINKSGKGARKESTKKLARLVEKLSQEDAEGAVSIAKKMLLKRVRTK